jgi:DNA-binding IclR family transcriptional regulator
MSVAGRDTGASRGVQSVEIGMRIIGALGAATGALSLKALAAAAGLPASNCHRYCVSLVRAGYLRQDSRSNRYDLGPRLIEAGLAALARTDAVAVATEALEGLVDATGHTGQLTIWAAQGPTIIRWIHGRAAVRTSIATGTTLPLLTSATGRVFLAYLPARQTAALAAREAMEGGGDPAALAAQVRASGIGRVAGDHIPGLSAIAAAVFDVHGEPASVLTLLAARGGIVPGAADQLRAAASAASSRLGFATPCQSGSG